MNGIFLLLGSNIGDKLHNLGRAIDILDSHGVGTIRVSPVYATEPWGKTDQEWFLNVVIEIRTMLSPFDLLAHCLETELKMGRKRMEKWGSRIIDIDILYYHDQIIDADTLKVPHVGIPDRKFTLTLLAELIPEEKHPLLGLTQDDLLKQCADTSACIKTEFDLN